MTTTHKLLVDDGRTLTVYALPARLVDQLLGQAIPAAHIRPVHEGWQTTTVDGVDTFPRGDCGRAVCHVLGIADRAGRAPAADNGRPKTCPWCALPADHCPDPDGHDRLDRASETTWRRTAGAR